MTAHAKPDDLLINPSLSSRPHRSDTISTEEFVYNDSIVRQFLATTLIWAVGSIALGLYVNSLAMLPLTADSSVGLTFGRLLPLLVFAITFGVVCNAIFTGVYYSTQRLCKTRLWSSTLGQLHFWMWQATFASGCYTILGNPFNTSDSTLLCWPLHLSLLLEWTVLFGINFIATLLVRRERYLYISIWFYLATIIGFILVELVQLIGLPLGNAAGYQLAPYFSGANAAFVQAWCERNTEIFLGLMPFIGMLYYFVPHASGGVVRSYRWAVIQFWSLTILLIWSGAHGLYFTAASDWLTGLSFVITLVLLMPLLSVFVNLWQALTDTRSSKFSKSVQIYFVAALLYLQWLIIDDTLLGMHALSSILNYSSWVAGHQLALLIGFVGLTTVGFFQFIAPDIFQHSIDTKSSSDSLSSGIAWLAIIASIAVALPMYVAGVVEGAMWAQMDENYQLRFTFITTLQSIRPIWWCAIVGTVVLLVVALLFAFRVIKFWAVGPRRFEKRLTSAGRYDPAFTEPVPQPSQLDIVLEMAKSIDVWKRLEWHRSWERRPIRLAFWITVAMLLGILVQALPIWLTQVGSTQTASVGLGPYTPLELAGRAIYMREGCVQCHTQMVRTLISDTKRYGSFIRASDTVYDAPSQWGERRIGPDLAREAGKQSNLWHYEHLIDPRSSEPSSLMPSFAYLAHRPIDYVKLKVQVKSATTSLPKYPLESEELSARAKDQAMEMAAILVQQGGPVRTQDLEITAVIAYLQRLGKQ